MTLAFHTQQMETQVQIDKEALWKSTLASTMMISPFLIFETTIGKNLAVTQTLIIEILTVASIYTL